jgi:diketogulonate reductase-like aldo/keto reductase
MERVMETIGTQGVAIPRLGFGTFRMAGNDAQPVVERVIGVCNFNLPMIRRALEEIGAPIA